jgi:uncharacterized protein with PhoU and TrkA domain
VDLARQADLGQRLRQLRVPDTSKLVGLTLSESRLGDAVDVQILCIRAPGRDGPDPTIRRPFCG